jgi:hypothetical protein
MKRVQAELKNGIFNLMMKVGNISDESVHRGMRLFKTEVLPQVADL